MSFIISSVIVSDVSQHVPFLSGSPVLVTNEAQVCFPTYPSTSKATNF